MSTNTTAPDWKHKALDIVKHLTWLRLILYVVAVVFAISAYTVWENRQNLFNRASISLNSTVDDFILEPPTKVGQGIIADFMKQHPDVVMLSIFDANPIDNTRTVIYRTFNDPKLRVYIDARVVETPHVGDGPLFTADTENNKHVLAILNGEFGCSDIRTTSMFARAYPEAAERAPYQCRIPLPPSFGKATGWFAIQLAHAPNGDAYEQLKIEALLMSLNYYNLEVLKQAQAARDRGRQN